MSMCRCLSSGAFLRSSPSSRWIGRLPTTPGIGPSRVEDLEPLADEHDRVPAADRREPQVAVVVDVVDDQPDLVDVAGDRQHRPVARAAHARDGRADRVLA